MKNRLKGHDRPLPLRADRVLNGSIGVAGLGSSSSCQQNAIVDTCFFRVFLLNVRYTWHRIPCFMGPSLLIPAGFFIPGDSRTNYSCPGMNVFQRVPPEPCPDSLTYGIFRKLDLAGTKSETGMHIQGGGRHDAAKRSHRRRVPQSVQSVWDQLGPVLRSG